MAEETLIDVEIPVSHELDDIVRGMMFAALAITDDKPDTLKKVSRANPWQAEALRTITGSEEEAHMPLTHILKEYMDLDLDCHIDVSGITKGGHVLDNQGYIAHNDEIIVLSYRCTTSAFDWITNLNTTSSQWEIEEDFAQGFSGYCSSMEGLCCGEYKPRVHTGFYNNFLVSLPQIKEHLEPLLAADQPQRKLYVCGHSLGAGVATLAACYFLLEFDWASLPHTLVNVTAGSPRAICTSMYDAITERREMLGSSARIYRIVKGNDVVATVPPALLGYRHITGPVFIDRHNSVIMKTMSMNDAGEAAEGDALQQLVRSMPPIDDTETDNTEKSRYEKYVSRIPGPLRDHMPDFYLKPLFELRGIKDARFESDREEETLEPAVVVKEVVPPPPKKKRGLRGMFRRRAHSRISAEK